MDVCPKCGSNNIDVYRFSLPFELPIPLLMAVSKSIRGELERLLKKYSTIELHICGGCGYTEVVFRMRS